MAEPIEADWNQIHYLPAQIEDWVGAEHEARYIRSFVEELDLEDLGFASHLGGGRGRPPYSSRLLLRVWLYGYVRKIRSSRKLERACQQDMGFIWLCGTHQPDHNSLWRFWRSHRKQIKKVFMQTVTVAAKLELIDFISQAVDGTRIQAVCSSRGAQGKEGLDKLLEKAKAAVQDLEKTLESNGDSAGAQTSKLPKELTNARTLQEKIRQAKATVESGKTKYVQPHEPQARRMNTHRGKRNTFGYNAQVAVDGKHQIITATQVVSDNNDNALLDGMIDQSEKNTGRTTATTLADGGYSSGDQIARAEAKKRDVVMPLPSSSQNRGNDPYHSSNFTYDAQREVVICPQGKELLLLRNRHKEKSGTRIFRNKKACDDCPVRSFCTQQKYGRTIEIHTHHQSIEAHRSKMSEQRSESLYKKRTGIVEPVFAWIKIQDQFTRWTVQGLENTRAQWAWLCTAINLRKIIQSQKTLRQADLNRRKWLQVSC